MLRITLLLGAVVLLSLLTWSDAQATKPKAVDTDTYTKKLVQEMQNQG